MSPIGSWCLVGCVLEVMEPLVGSTLRGVGFDGFMASSLLPVLLTQVHAPAVTLPGTISQNKPFLL